MSTTTPRTVSTLRTPTVRVLVFAAAVAVAGMLSGCGAGGQDTPPPWYTARPSPARSS